MVSLKDFVKDRSRLFDAYIKAKRVLRIKTPSYDALDQFSRSLRGQVRFLQIGASDGLFSDPIREFVVRDRWGGLFVEPLPYSFERLIRNYGYLRNPDLNFLNASVSTTSDHLDLWVVSDECLSRLPLSQRMELLQKSSTKKEHVQQFLDEHDLGTAVLTKVSTPCFGLPDLLDTHFSSGGLDLLVLDVEGYEQAIIMSIEFQVHAPTAIFYESHHLADGKIQVQEFLEGQGYQCVDLAGDTFAVSNDLALSL